MERVAVELQNPGARVLDLCCGTGDLLLALEDHSEPRPPGNGCAILGSDFCHPMLVEAQRKIAARRLRSPLFEADALALPLAEGSLDLITVAFGFRNLANYTKGLEELLRVLKPGGVAAILEFSQPTHLIGPRPRLTDRAESCDRLGTCAGGDSSWRLYPLAGRCQPGRKLPPGADPTGRVSTNLSQPDF